MFKTTFKFRYDYKNYQLILTELYLFVEKCHEQAVPLVAVIIAFSHDDEEENCADQDLERFV